MKLTVAVLLLTAACQAVEVKDTSRRQKADTNTEKRELTEGSTNVEKRAPVLPAAPSPVTPGIEYADTTETHADKAPSRQIYPTPLPQITKISDVLTGQGPPFQAAIASHLYSPVSIYQRLGGPRTYEISNPIASQLAYSEHKISYQPPQNALQYNEPLQYNQKLPNLKQPNFVRPINFQPQQQLFVQPALYSHQPQLVPAPLPVYQQLPQLPFQQRPQFVQNQVQQIQNQGQPIYTQEQQNLVQVFPAEPGVTYAREESTSTPANEQQTQQSPKSEEQRAELKTVEKQTPAPQQNYNLQPQGPVSFASFSQGQPAPSFGPPALQFQAQPPYETQPFFRVQPQPQPQQLLPQIHYQIPPQFQLQVQNEPAKPQETLTTASTKILPPIPGKQVSFRPGPVFPQLQPQFQPQTYQQNSNFLPPLPQTYQQTPNILPPQPQPYQQNPNILPLQPQGSPSSLSLVPSFPPVQYFGKFSQSIFGNYHPQ